MKKLFIGLSVGLTVLSMIAGFELYKNLFGYIIAFNIVLVFELLRLSSLYSIPKMKGIYKITTSFLYIFVAVLCFFASSISFNSNVVEKAKNNEQILKIQNKEIKQQIKQAYHNQIEEKLKKIEQNLANYNEKYARFKYPTYKRIIENLITQKEQIFKQENEFFNKVDNGDKQFIENQMAIYNIKEKFINTSKISAIEEAIRDLTGLSVLGVQKLFGIMISLAIEFGILLLAYLGMGLEIKKTKKRGRPKGSKNKKKTNKENTKRDNRIYKIDRPKIYQRGKRLFMIGV